MPAMLALSGCVPITDLPELDLVVVKVEGAVPPKVGPPIAYKLSENEAIDPIDSQLGQAAHLVVTVATQVPENVRIQLLDVVTGRKSPMQRVSSEPVLSNQRYANRIDERDRKVRALLVAGHSIFWTSASETGKHTIEHELQIAIPTELVTPFMQLEFSLRPVDDASAGTVVIDLVQDFLYIGVIGDSILWGNGLEEEDKIITHVVTTLESETGRRVIVQQFAQSAATVIPSHEDGICTVDCNPETPTTHTSITTQAGLIEHGELIELLLMNGCINDVSPVQILNPALDMSTLERVTD
jgi:hypothetical protein